MHANVKGFFNEVNKTAAISLISINLIQMYPQDVQLELLHHNVKLHPDQMKNVQGNETNSFALC